MTCVRIEIHVGVFKRLSRHSNILTHFLIFVPSCLYTTSTPHLPLIPPFPPRFLSESALAHVLCSADTVYGDVAGQMFVVQALVDPAQFHFFQHLASQGILDCDLDYVRMLLLRFIVVSQFLV
jgi:hypothetical protein